MTLITALIVGIATGLLVANRRRRLWITALAVTVMLAFQSFVLPLLVKVTFSLHDPGYWGTQPFILLFGVLVSLGIGHLRFRRDQAHSAL